MTNQAPELRDVVLLITRLVPAYLPGGGSPVLEPATPLFGKDGILDSTGLVSLVVALEQGIQDEYGISISLADDRALSRKSSPYRTIGSLAEYAVALASTGG